MPSSNRNSLAVPATPWALNFLLDANANDGLHDLGLPWYNTSEYATLNALVAAAGAGPYRIIVNAHIHCTADLALGAGIVLEFEPNNDIEVDNAVTFTINSPGHIHASPRQKIFTLTGTGLVAFTEGGEVHPGWWGAVADGANDDGPEINAAIAAVSAAGGGVVRLQTGVYATGETLTMLTGASLRGDEAEIRSTVVGTANTEIFLLNNSDCDVVSVAAGVKNVTLASLYLNGNGANQASGNGVTYAAGAACFKISHCKLCYCKQKGVSWAGGYGWIVESTAYRNYEEGLYITGGDLTILNVESQDNDAGNTSSYSNVHLTATSAAVVAIALQCGNDLTTGQDGLLIDANSNTHRFIGCFFLNNTRYGVNNSGFRVTFDGCKASGKAAANCHAFVENGSATVIAGGAIIAAHATAYGLYVTGGSAGYWCRVSATELGISAGGLGFFIAAGKGFYRDGVFHQPEAAGDAARELILAPNTTTNNVGGQIRVGTSTDDGVTGISIRGIRSAAGGHGYWQFFTRDAGGENERVRIDAAGILNAYEGASISKFIDGGITAGIVAANPGVQGDVPLTTRINVVATVANANDAVTAPAAVAGRELIIINNGANTLEIWPAAGDDLGAGVNTAVTLAAATNRRYIAIDGTNWEIV